MKFKYHNIDVPQDDLFTDWLLFIVKSLDENDPSLPFLSGLLSYAYAKDGLTEKQRKAAEPYLEQARKFSENRGFE